MKAVLFFFSWFVSCSTFAQLSEEISVRACINSFFEAFHRRDSTALRQTVGDGAVLQTVYTGADGKAVLKGESFNDFLKAIASIPKEKVFEEKLQSFRFEIDGALAHVWVPYEFWFDGRFNHCGVNSFQLFKNNDHWQIIYLIDTRRKEGCKP